MPAFLYLQLLSACFWSAALYAKCSNCLQIKRVPNPVKIEEGYLRSVAKTQYSALQKIYTAVFSCNLSHEPADSIKTINTSFCYFFFFNKKTQTFKQDLCGGEKGLCSVRICALQHQQEPVLQCSMTPACTHMHTHDPDAFVLLSLAFLTLCASRLNTLFYNVSFIFQPHHSFPSHPHPDPCQD